MQGSLQPRRSEGMPGRSRRLVAGAALEEHQVRPIFTAWSRHLPGEDLDLLAPGLIVVKRQRQPMVGDEHARDTGRPGLVRLVVCRRHLASSLERMHLTVAGGTATPLQWALIAQGAAHRARQRLTATVSREWATPGQVETSPTPH